MILVQSTVERINSLEIKISFPRVFVEQLHLKIHPINTPKTIHVWTESEDGVAELKEIGFINCVFDQGKIYKKKIKLQTESSFILLKCEAYNEFVEFMEVQVFALELFKELPSMVEDLPEFALPNILESCSIAIPKEILVSVASSDFAQRHEALLEIATIVKEQPDNNDLTKCIGSLLNFLLIDNRPKIVLLRIQLAKAVSDLLHLERILESAYDYHEYIQAELIDALVDIKMPLHMLLKNKPKLIPVCLKVIERVNYKASSYLAEFILNATKTPHRALALQLWYDIQPKLDDKTVISMVEKEIENSRLRAILFKNMEIEEENNNFRHGFIKSSSKSSLTRRSRPTTASTVELTKNPDVILRKTKSHAEPLSRNCVFCDQSFSSCTNIDRHYYECPMLMLCSSCDEIIEVANYHSHALDLNAHSKLDNFCCPFCKQHILPENKIGWRLHLLGDQLEYNKISSDDTKIPVRQRHCSGKRVQIN